MSQVTLELGDDKVFVYERIGYVPEYENDPKVNLIWHFNCLGWTKGEFDISGKQIYHHPGYEVYDGFVISAPTIDDAIKIAIEKIDENLESTVHWTIELVGAAFMTYDKPIVMKSNTGA